jgi:putative ABC transport system permease protein
VPFTEIVHVALQSIQANLFRAILTMLGIIIGVGAVITMLAAGAGAQRQIDEQIAALGSNILSINASRFFARGIARNQLTLEIEDVAALKNDARYLDLVVPELTDRRQIKYENVNTNARLTGTNAEFFELYRYPVALGRTFTEAEDLARQRVVVLGSEIPQQLEVEPAALLDRTINVNGQPFRVIGILASIGSGAGNNNPDTSAYIPIMTAEQRVMGQEQLDNINVRVIDDVPLERAMVDIERVLRREHRILPGQPNDFGIVDRREFLDTQQQAQETFTALLASIAGVSLLVGGIGIMNIMLVSVTLCVLGGLLGVGLGAGAANLLSTYFGWETFVSPDSVVMASTFSVGVGLFFGIWPARRAARLDPIEALRYE